MFQQERMNEILTILRRTHYATVDYLVKEIRYSPASIRRDLTLLEKQGLVKRTYGGVELNAENDTPFAFRVHNRKSEKNRIAAEAAKLIENGMTVFLDASTTTQYLAHHLADKKDITVVTNNMALAIMLGEQGIEVYCSGGRLSEVPGTLTGTVAANGFSSFRADIMFFSTDGITEDGMITIRPEPHFHMTRAMMAHAVRRVYLCGGEKLGRHVKHVLCDLSEIDTFISDGALSAETVARFPHTEFRKV